MDERKNEDTTAKETFRLLRILIEILPAKKHLRRNGIFWGLILLLIGFAIGSDYKNWTITVKRNSPPPIIVNQPPPRPYKAPQRSVARDSVSQIEESPHSSHDPRSQVIIDRARNGLRNNEYTK